MTVYVPPEPERIIIGETEDGNFVTMDLCAWYDLCERLADPVPMGETCPLEEWRIAMDRDGHSAAYEREQKAKKLA